MFVEKTIPFSKMITQPFCFFITTNLNILSFMYHNSQIKLSYKFFTFKEIQIYENSFLLELIRKIPFHFSMTAKD